MNARTVPLAVAATVALLYIDVEYIVALFGSGVLSQLTLFELMVVALQVGKTEALFAVPKLRNASG
ncbi:MAG: hypothetical protein JRN54_03395, partial [Nitrososphaerota archaeon]|nr:hypothetical protein [Nitrososphaerota archaeon]